MNETQTCKKIFLCTCLSVECEYKCNTECKWFLLSLHRRLAHILVLTSYEKICINSFIMPRTSFIEKSRKHNFHLKGTRKKSATQETLLIALRHLIRVV